MISPYIYNSAVNIAYKLVPSSYHASNNAEFNIQDAAKYTDESRECNYELSDRTVQRHQVIKKSAKTFIEEMEEFCEASLNEESMERFVTSLKDILELMNERFVLLLYTRKDYKEQIFLDMTGAV